MSGLSKMQQPSARLPKNTERHGRVTVSPRPTAGVPFLQTKYPLWIECKGHGSATRVLPWRSAFCPLFGRHRRGKQLTVNCKQCAGNPSIARNVLAYKAFLRSGSKMESLFLYQYDLVWLASGYSVNCSRLHATIGLVVA